MSNHTSTPWGRHPSWSTKAGPRRDARRVAAAQVQVLCAGGGELSQVPLGFAAGLSHFFFFFRRVLSMVFPFFWVSFRTFCVFVLTYFHNFSHSFTLFNMIYADCCQSFTDFHICSHGFTWFMLILRLILSARLLQTFNKLFFLELS